MNHDGVAEPKNEQERGFFGTVLWSGMSKERKWSILSDARERERERGTPSRILPRDDCVGYILWDATADFFWILIEDSEYITVSHDSPLKNHFELWSDLTTEWYGTGIQFDLSGAIARTCHSSRLHSKLVDRINKCNLYRLDNKTPMKCTSTPWHKHTDVRSLIQELNETNPGCNRKRWKWVGLNYLSFWPDIFLRPPTVGWSIIPGWSSIFLFVFIENIDHIPHCRYHYSCMIYSVACYCSKTWIGINDYFHDDNEHCFAPSSPSGRHLFVYDAVQRQANHSMEIWQFDFITKLEVNGQLLIKNYEPGWDKTSSDNWFRVRYRSTHIQLNGAWSSWSIHLLRGSSIHERRINSPWKWSRSLSDYVWRNHLLIVPNNES